MILILLLLHISLTLSMRGGRDSEEWELPGQEKYLVDPQMDVASEGMRFAFGTARRPVDKEAFVEVDMDGRKMELPKGIYHYSQHETGADASWRIPEDGQFFNGKMGMKDNFRNIDGIYLRHPLMKPINVQLITERNFENGFEGGAMERTPAAALAEARRVCAKDEGEECEKALNRYYEIRSEEIAQENAPLHEQLAKLSDLASNARLRGRNGHGLGMVLDLPGQEKPLYVGAALDNFRRNNINVLFQPPKGRFDRLIH